MPRLEILLPKRLLLR
ncbi:hypothetical protein Patl1_35470 [Pistacia atlantica]|nr:hypothetical protein Patl1_35470 [Pistacia atlantica]